MEKRRTLKSNKPEVAKAGVVAEFVQDRADRIAGTPAFFDWRSWTSLLVQSICFNYAGTQTPHLESDAIESHSVRAMEFAALNTAGIDGIVLRYGRLWGPGTWTETPADLVAPLHVDAAAQAAFLAITRGPAGILQYCR